MTEEVLDGEALVRGEDDVLSERWGDIDIIVLDVMLLELVTEALSVAVNESVALQLAKDVVVEVCEGDFVT